MATDKIQSSATSSIGFFSLLALMLIGLKLTRMISWSWWWVLAPLWAPTAILICFTLAIVVLFVVFHAVITRAKR